MALTKLTPDVLDALQAKNPGAFERFGELLKKQPRKGIDAWREIHPEDFAGYAPNVDLDQITEDNAIVTKPPTPGTTPRQRAKETVQELIVLTRLVNDKLVERGVNRAEFPKFLDALDDIMRRL